MSDSSLPGTVASRRILQVLLGAAAAAFVLGLWGFRQYDGAHGGEGDFLDHLYYTTQLYVLHGHHLEPPVPFSLQLARLLAPILPIYGVVRGLAILLRGPLRSLRLRLLSGHVVVVGDGPGASHLANDFRARGRDVILASSEGADAGEGLLRRGVLRCSGPLGATVLAQLRIPHCERVVLADESDDVNLGTCLGVRELLERESALRAVPCDVHIFDVELRRLFDRHATLARIPGRFRPITFNVFADEARRLLDRHPLDRIPVDSGSPLTVRLAIVGFGRMGLSLALQAIRIGHFANGRRLAIEVFDGDAARLGAIFHARYPEVREVMEIGFCEKRAPDAGLLDDLQSVVEAPDSLPTLALCLPDAAQNVSIALDLLPLLREHRAPALVRIRSGEGLRRVVEAESSVSRVIHPFGAIEDTWRSDPLVGSDRDELARVIHETFRARKRAEGRSPSDPSMLDWEELPDELRESNRQQADHIPVKLRGIRCSIPSSGDPLARFDGFHEDEIETLARMEHERWRAERYLAGWTRADERDVERRRSPSLMPWDRLPPEVQKRDREAVEDIPALLGRLGKQVSR